MEKVTVLRIDKWLWAARFFKTRKLAAAAVSGGKVQLNGQRTKPSKEVKIDSQLIIHKEHFTWDITILGINTHRRPSTEAVLLYQESAESIAKREKEIIQRREERQFSHAEATVRPNKKQRRQIHQFKQS